MKLLSLTVNYTVCLVLLFFIAAAQAQFGGCFSNSVCTTTVSATSAEDCCVNSVGTYFTNGAQCLQCIVYGWGAPNFTKPENQQPQQVPMAYFKGPAGVVLIIQIDDTEMGTASSDDYTQNTNIEVATLDPDRTVSIIFRPDNFALEPNETIIFGLDVLAVNPSSMTAEFDAALPNVFYQQNTTLFIEDSTELVFRLREADRQEIEDSGSIEVVVEVANQRDLASPISLLLTPSVAEEGFMPLPDTLQFARANTHAGRIDFTTTPIRLDFPVGRTRELTASVPIIDDNINEALEFFRGDLSFADPASVPDTVSIGSNVIRLDIVDDDDIYIGFQLPDTTYPEAEATHMVTIIKGENNVTEQVISAFINLVTTVPPGSGFDRATPSDDDGDNDFTFGTNRFSQINFGPDQNALTVLLNIFGDDLPENTEAAQLTLEAPTDDSPRFELLAEFPNFFIIIPDNDGFRVGFENISYTVNEGIGFQEVCLRMFEPSDDTPISGSFFVVVETVADTADESDYTATSGFGAVACQFQRCSEKELC